MSDNRMSGAAVSVFEETLMGFEDICVEYGAGRAEYLDLQRARIALIAAARIYGELGAIEVDCNGKTMPPHPYRAAFVDGANARGEGVWRIDLPHEYEGRRNAEKWCLAWEQGWDSFDAEIASRAEA